MWRPPINFVTLHYAWIIFMGLLAIPVLYPQGNMAAVDAYFFGASASTESGLNTVDLKALKTYQQLYLYFIPMFTNLGFINIAVVIVRLIWFNKRLRTAAPSLFKAKRRNAPSNPEDRDVEATSTSADAAVSVRSRSEDRVVAGEPEDDALPLEETESHREEKADVDDHADDNANDNADATKPPTHLTFHSSAEQRSHPKNDATLYIPGPRDRDHGHPLVELKKDFSISQQDLDPNTNPTSSAGPSTTLRRRRPDGPRINDTKSLERAVTIASSMFVLGSETPRRRPSSASAQNQQQPALNDMPFLSRQVTVGRNSQFHNLTKRDREELGGVEYRSLKLLLKIVTAYFFGLHLFGAICLVAWVQYADPKYTDYLEASGQNKNWWAFYSAQTMVDNLGFTLTPDSMISFRDATWPMLVMSFLAFAGNTLYPVFLRLVIWTTSKLAPRNSSIQEPLTFLLNHPRRCYTLLFPSGTTWALFGIIFALNFVDALLIVVLDLHNESVTDLPLGPRILAAIFQAASSRHTGTSTFNLANVNPAVQFSLLVMMYIAIFPIAMSIRASNTYEEKALGIYEDSKSYDEGKGSAYLWKHMQNQLSFDLWYIFLGIFCVAVAESDKVMDVNEPAFALFPLFFEVTSAYGNVGLSLGYPTVATSLSGKFSPFSKVVICAMMIRGRHRGLPYQLDRAIMLPDEQLIDDSAEDTSNTGNGQ